MDHSDHVNLLRNGVLPGGVWADLGAGSGAFTLALAELAGPETTISPTWPWGTSKSSDQAGIASSVMRIMRTFAAPTGRPTQTPLPCSVRCRVSLKISSLPIEATGSDSVAP